jgi:hypothetical protein
MPLVVQPADVYRMISAALVIMNGPRDDATACQGLPTYEMSSSDSRRQ